MKNILYIIVVFTSHFFYGQEIKVPNSLMVSEGIYLLDGIDRNGFDIVLQGEEKDINTAWANYLTEKFGFKMKTKGATANGEEFNNPIWSDKQFAINSAVIKDGSGPHLRVWMLFGADIFVSSTAYSIEAANLKAVIKEFSKAYYVAVFQKELDDQTKVIVSQGKEIEGISKDKEKEEKAIAKAQSSIAKAEKSKAKTLQSIEKAQAKIIDYEAEIRKNQEKISGKKNEIDKKSVELSKEEDKYKNVGQDAEMIKAKIRAVQAL